MSLAERYDALFIDLDGVVYRGDRAVPAALTTLPLVRAKGVPVLFLTNNSARTPQEVAAMLSSMGIQAGPGEILTSARATAAMLEQEGSSGKTAFVIGERGIREALEQIGVKLQDGEPDRTDLVVVGWDRAVDYGKLRTASLLVQRGARLIATNADASYPAADGLWPGAGALLAAVVTTTGAVPTIVGKPSSPLFEAAIQATGADRPLVVGDRLDTDIGGAAAMGWDSLLVLSGAAQPPDLLTAESLPTYVGPDLSTLTEAPPAGRFRLAHETDLSSIRGLLDGAGLRSEGLEGRLGGTLVSAGGSDGEKEVDATACVETRRNSALLRSVAVRPGVRRRGLGMLAAAAAVRLAKAKGASRVYLLTETAPRFFKALGFQVIERGDLPQAIRDDEAARECVSAVPMFVDVSG